MENISNVSSEEELLQLRNEGKISEDEYEELRSAMRKSTKPDFELPPVAAESPKSKRRLGKIAFYFMLAGIILPAVWYFGMIRRPAVSIPAPTKYVVGPNGEKATAPAGEEFAEVTVGETRHGWPPWLTGLILILEIAAFVMGVIAWPDVFAKATVVTILSIVVLVFPFLLIAVIVFPI